MYMHKLACTYINIYSHKLVHKITTDFDYDNDIDNDNVDNNPCIDK